MSQPTARPTPELRDPSRRPLITRAGLCAASAARFFAAQLVATYSFGVCTSPDDTAASS